MVTTVEARVANPLRNSDFIWKLNDDGSYTVDMHPDAVTKLNDSLTPVGDAPDGSPGSLAPVLDEDFAEEIKKDKAKKQALQNYLDAKAKKSYEDVIREQLEIQLWATVQKLLDAMKGTELDEFVKDREFIEAYQELQKSLVGRERPEYNNLCKFCKVFESTAKRKKKEFEDNNSVDAKSYNSIYRSLVQVGLLYNYDVPKHVATMQSLITLDETKHVKKPKKRSFWSRFWDKVKVFFGMETQERVEEYQYKLGSVGKGITKYVTESVAGSFTNNADQYLNYFKNNKAAKAKRAKGERVDFALGEVQVKQPEASTGISKMAVAKGVGQAVLAGIAGAVADKMPWQSATKLAEYIANTDEEVLQTNLSDHLEKAFSYEAKKQAFETLMHFVRDMYVLSEQMYADGSDPAIAEQMPLARLGFERLGEDGFRDFVLRLSTALGFDLDAYKRAHPELNDETELGLAVHLLYNADEKMREAAFANFLAGDPEKGIGLQFASDAFKKEFNAVKAANVENSDNYFYLLDLNMQVIEDLYTKTISKNAVREALKAGQLEERIYNPDAKGAGTKVTGALKQQLAAALPNCMSQYMKSAAEKKALAQKMSGAYCEGIANEYDRRYKEKHPPVEYIAPQVQQAPAEKGYLAQLNDYLWGFAGYDTSEPEPQPQPLAKPEGQPTNRPPVKPAAQESSTTMMYARKKQASANADKWQAAQARVEEAGVPEIVKSKLADIVRKKTNKVWQKQAKHTLDTIIDWGGMPLLKEINHLLTEEYGRLRETQAHADFVNDVESQLRILASIIQDYESDPDKFKQLNVQETKKLFDAIRAGVCLKYGKGQYKNIDDQAVVLLS